MSDTAFSFLLEPFQYPFMSRALVSGLFIATACALLSCYLVLKGWALMGDAVSHAVLPGIVIAYITNLPLAVGAFLSGLLCSIIAGYLKENSRIKEDTILGIVYSGMFALGLVLFNKIETSQHLPHILFGNMLGISDSELLTSVFICSLVTITLVLFRRDLLLYCFDKSHAHVSGLPVQLLHYFLLVMLSMTVVSAIQAVGVLMVVAMLVSPGITARVLSRRFSYMLPIAVAISICSVYTGIIISFTSDGSTSACIVLTQTTFFVCSLTIRKSHTFFKSISILTKLTTPQRSEKIRKKPD